jgi:hypothetical protein
MGLAAAPVEVPAAKLAEGLGAQTLKAYHGSPHDFDQFSLSKIGTGEGAQAYGHGLYFAENPKVAGEYKLAGPEANRQFDTINQRLSALSKEMDQLSPNGYRQWKDPVRGKQLAEEYDTLLESKNKIGKTYEVNLHTSPDELLDWDKPLSQQSPKVQEAIGKLPGSPVDIQKAIDLYTPRLELGGARAEMAKKELAKLQAQLSNAQNMSGEQWYQRLVGQTGSRAGHTEGIASGQLKDAGIKGIQYLDQGSRGGYSQATQGMVSQFGSREQALTGLQARLASNVDPERAGILRGMIDELKNPPTKNFVIFDDKIIEIAKKYGVALPVAAEIFRRQQIGAKNGNVESSLAPH